ncbi:MAG: hypothetical protein ACE5LQ_05605 [Candidatus Bipolaricaulia bacterium]
MRMRWSIALALFIALPLIALPARAEGLGVGLKAALYPLERFGLDEAFVYLRMSDFLGVEGLTAILEGGLGFSLKTISLDTKLLLTRFALDHAALIPFTGGGLTLALEADQGEMRLELIPEGLAGLEYSLPPLLLLGEMRVQSERGMTILLGLAIEL